MLQHLAPLLHSALYLIPAAIISGFHIALQGLGKIQGKEELKTSSRFIFFPFFARNAPKDIWESILFTLDLAKFTYYLIFGCIFFHFISLANPGIDPSRGFFTEVAYILLLFFLLELFLFLLVEKSPKKGIQFLSLPASFLILPYLPIALVYFTCKKLLLSDKPSDPLVLPFKPQEKFLDYLSESELDPYLDKTEKKLIHTVICFKDRIVREIMVPRINIFSLSADTSLLDAARYFSEEGYSRIPIYKETIDKIIGVLLYKDVLSLYTKHIEKKGLEETLSKSVEHFVKPVLYTPETKKIAQLLQEFRNKQIHLAIVVDEYGGTEGIVTIEDILEELVGNIQDEYDTQEEKLFSALSSGGWIVDAKISILDLEENLGIHIPTHAEYDTIGGYIFHKAGSIPSKGWKIHLDSVDLEILQSDERSIQKIKIIPNQEKNKKAD